MKKFYVQRKSLLLMILLLFILLASLAIFAGCGTNKTNSEQRIQLRSYMVQEIEDTFYNGQKLEPEVTLIDNGVYLKQGVDYNVTYANNVEAGQGTVYITGIGKYCQTVITYFNILSSFQDKLNQLLPGEKFVLNQNYTGSLTIPEGVSLELENDNMLYLENETTLLEGASIINNGIIVLRTGATLDLNLGTIINNGQINVIGHLKEGVYEKTLINNNKIVLDGGEIDISNAIDNQGQLLLNWGSTINVGNLKMLSIAQSLINSSSIIDNTIILKNDIDLEGVTLKINRNNILNLQSYSLTNGNVINTGKICVQTYQGLKDAISYCDKEGTIEIINNSQIILDEKLVIPSGVTLKISCDLKISSTNSEENYIDVQGQIIGGNDKQQIELAFENLIRNAKNYFYDNVMFVNVRAGIYEWNQAQLKWFYIPQI